MTLQPSNCPSCSQYITCQSCTATGLCEWWSEEAKCERRGRYQAAIVATQECYEPCHERVTCSQCLQTSRCVWCAATQVPSIVLQGVPKVPCQSQNFRVFYLDILHKKSISCDTYSTLLAMRNQLFTLDFSSLRLVVSKFKKVKNNILEFSTLEQ